MKRLILASCAALLILAPVLAFAQNRTPPAGSSTVGSATPRGGESTGSSSAPSSGSASERGGGTSGGGGSFASPAGGASMRGNYDGPRSGDSMPSARPRNASAGVGQAVPASERPRGDRPVYGQAVPRSQAVQNNQTAGAYYPYSNYYDPYYGGSYGWYGYYGNYWNPWNPWTSWSTINPYVWGPYGWSMWPMSMYSSYWYDYAAGVGPAVYTSSANGSIKLKVKPKEAEVYVDGTYYGHVDDYDGAFQHLDLSPGTHRVELRADSYQTLQVEVRVLPGKTITYNGELKPAK